MRIAASLLTLTALIAPAQAFAQGAPAGAAPAAPAAAPAAPAAAPKIEVGATVLDPKGGEVGKIEQVSGPNIVLATPTNKVTLPATAIAAWPAGLTIAMTREELDAAASAATAKNTAALESALVAGAQTHSIDGSKMVGTIKAIEAENIVLTTERGDIQLPKGAFTMGPAGLSVAMSAEQFDQALNQALPKS